MKRRSLGPTRREVIAGLAASLAGVGPGGATPAGPTRLSLQARPATLRLQPDQPATAISELAGANGENAVRLRRGERCEVTFRNDLSVPAAPAWHGLDGSAGLEPLLHAPIAAGATETSILSTSHAGTLIADLRLFDDGLRHPARPLPILVQETEPVPVDRDELFLVEDWRLTSDGTAMLAGSAPGNTTALFTVNGKLMPDFTLRANERIRLRIINGCQRTVIATKFDLFEILVMALDGQPVEPFVARNNTLILAPGGRADVFLDGTASPGAASPILLHDGKEAREIARLLVSAEAAVRPSRLPPPEPLPSNGLPDRLDLRSALRLDLALGADGGDWSRPASFSASTAPAFRAKAGRVVVLTLKNPGPIAIVFHLHGHHFRLLDRLDDGWKPYWLDTLAIEPAQTQHIAFAATFPGRWLIESVGADWTAPRLVRWYAVE